MRTADRMTESVRTVEALMLEHFRTEPFHNLHLIYGARFASVPGGTCSDKTLSFIASGRAAGLDVSLHTAFIGGREIHRLARVCIEDQLFFADVGNGWPSLKLYPADHETSFRCFGMGFRTEVSDGRVVVFRESGEGERMQLEINVRARPESDIRADIENRFSSDISYPFSDSLRFAMVVGEQFLFLRGNRLEIYDDFGVRFLECIDDAQILTVLNDYFGFDIREKSWCQT